MTTSDSDLEREPADDPESADLVTLRKFQDFLDASLAKSSVESAGIDCFLSDAYQIGHVGPVNLQVRRGDLDAALGILEQPIPESFEVEGVGNFQQPRCPACGSLDVNSEDVKSTDLNSQGVTAPGIPSSLDSAQMQWQCQTCQHEWQDANAEA